MENTLRINGGTQQRYREDEIGSGLVQAKDDERLDDGVISPIMGQKSSQIGHE